MSSTNKTADGPGVAGDGFAVTELESESSLWLVEDGVSVWRDDVDALQSWLVDKTSNAASDQVPVVHVQTHKVYLTTDELINARFAPVEVSQCGLVAWRSGNAFHPINEITLHWAGLVLE